MEKILWIRKLSCGHERPTNTAFMYKKYDKPRIGGECYCRICWESVNIISVRDSKQSRGEIDE